jgi:hypothetical protein
MAVVLTGSEQRVMDVMQVAAGDFAAYRGGEREPTWPQFDRLVQLVVAEQRKGIERRKAQIAHVRRNLGEQN